MERTTRAGPLRRVGGFFVRHAHALAVVTVCLTLFLILLGEYTAATGAGATCNNTYPGCAGHLSPIGLSDPQFVEWFHRLVAMTTGYIIVGNALATWWDHRQSRTGRAAWLAALLLPLQVFLGGFTVTLAGALPNGYKLPVQLSHFSNAYAIFLTLVASLVWLDIADGIGATVKRLRRVATLGLVAVLIQAIFARGTFLIFWPRIQTTYHLFALLGLAGFLALVLWGRELGKTDIVGVGIIGLIATLVNAYLVIGIVPITASIETITHILLIVQFICFAALTWLATRLRSVRPSSLARSSVDWRN